VDLTVNAVDIGCHIAEKNEAIHILFL